MNFRRALAATLAAAGILAAGATTASAVPTSPSVAGDLVGATMHANAVTLVYGTDTGNASSVQDVSFTFDGQYSITGGQPWGGVTASTPAPIQGSGETVITAQAGRHDSTAPATWFGWNSTAAIGGDSFHNGNPTQLNFAFAGTLAVDGNSYPVVIGQGSNAEGNNWWIGGQGWTAGSDGVINSPDGAYSLSIDWNPGGTPESNAFSLASNG